MNHNAMRAAEQAVDEAQRLLDEGDHVTGEALVQLGYAQARATLALTDAIHTLAAVLTPQQRYIAGLTTND